MIQEKRRAEPPSPPTLLPWGHLLPLARNPLPFLTRSAKAYGDVVRFRLGRQSAFLFNHPDLIREVLIVQDSKFVKGRVLQEAKRLLGEGLLTSEGEFHRRQRQLIQPVFQPRNLMPLAGTMADCAVKVREEWRDGSALDMSAEMRRLSLDVVGKTLFGSEVGEESERVGETIERAMGLLSMLSYPFASLLERLPLPALKRFERDKEWLNALIRRMIRERRESDSVHRDLLALLLEASDVEGGMSDDQVRDEAVTLFLAGHETVATALSWTFHLLSQNPQAEAKLRREIDATLRGRTPEYADLENLPYAEWTLAESMRILPPVWAIGRIAREDALIGDCRVPTGGLAIVSQWVMHRDPRYYPDPLRFEPERWSPEEKAKRPRFSYFPFGGGTRHCIGEGMAWMECVLLLATLAQKWRFRSVPGHPVQLRPLITLRAKHGLKMIAEARDGDAAYRRD
jgi:cytochrome P450